MTRFSVYLWKREEPEFAAQIAGAEEDAADVILREVSRRAIEGYDETITVIDGEGKVKTRTTVRKHDGNLLALLARARVPGFRDSIDVTSAGQPLIPQHALKAASEDPHAVDLAAELLERIARSGTDAGGTGVHRVEQDVAASATPTTAE